MAPISVMGTSVTFQKRCTRRRLVSAVIALPIQATMLTLHLHAVCVQMSEDDKRRIESQQSRSSVSRSPKSARSSTGSDYVYSQGSPVTADKAGSPTAIGAGEITAVSVTEEKEQDLSEEEPNDMENAAEPEAADGDGELAQGNAQPKQRASLVFCVPPLWSQHLC